MPAPVVSIITPTFQRAKDLWRLLEAVRLQQWGDGLIEHLVVPDGPPERATQTVPRAFPAEKRIRRRCVPLPESQGQFGAACKDAGLREAVPIEHSLDAKSIRAMHCDKPDPSLARFLTGLLIYCVPRLCEP